MSAKQRSRSGIATPADAELFKLKRRERRQARAIQQASFIREPSSLLHLATVSALVGLGPTAIYDRIRAGTFPQPKRLSARCSRWRAGEIRHWLDVQATNLPDQTEEGGQT
jgi:prophage regulatory protein